MAEDGCKAIRNGLTRHAAHCRPATPQLSGRWPTLKAANLDNQSGGFQFLEYLPAGAAAIDANDHRYVIAELDVLGRQVADMIRALKPQASLPS